jgi:hypothetical protein
MHIEEYFNVPNYPVEDNAAFLYSYKNQRLDFHLSLLSGSHARQFVIRRPEQEPDRYQN